jgi:hypothetical protein
MRWLTMLGLFLCLCGLLGCAEGAPTGSMAERSESQSKVYHGAVARQAQPVAGEDRADEPVAAKDADGAAEIQPPDKPRDPEKHKGAAGQSDETVKRKIIFTGSADLSVEDYDKAVREMRALVKNLKGYISNTDDSGKSGGQRIGTYTVRVPVDNFPTFMEDIEKIGELRHSKTNAQEITDQYYDTETRIKNDKLREQSLLELYKQTVAEKNPASERIKVTNELYDLRRGIEEQEGRLKRWDNQTSYSTVVVKLEQRKEYAPAGSPDFGTMVSRTWDGSLGALATFGKGVLLVAVALAPWLVVLGAVTSPLWYLLWRQLRKPRPAKPASPPPAAPSPVVVVEPA